MHTIAGRAGDWPRTTRVLPWLIAAMLAVVWLVPFNSIVLDASLPIDLKFDRPVLAITVATWVLVLAAGRPVAPHECASPRCTRRSARVLLVACLSLIVDAGYLAGTLELQTGIKKLTLLGSYVALFVVVLELRASARRSPRS